ncbi:YdcF family protein [Veronia pacifica]|uniref:DUF218 domain-containing protein n=1 Tax=Veronia pacifica TaxID=1080227 RepID=A0A1C3EMQ0_9GAMM|nr:YdcF family protein [Veronia pacifica]ODA34489.1 hypothetical protein A8L45_05830 [Veronia pacifica]
MNSSIYNDILAIWDYHQLEHQPVSADCIIVMGSNDLRVAEKAAELYLAGIAPVVVVSGGFGRFTRGVFQKPEAQLFADVMTDCGVPASSILVEDQSSNTGENVQLSWELLQRHKMTPERIQLVHKPYMERRAYATFLKQWPKYPQSIKISSPDINFLDYVTEEFPLDALVNAMMGDLIRMRDYPERGFQIEQVIPDDIWRSYHRLVDIGFLGS